MQDIKIMEIDINLMVLLQVLLAVILGPVGKGQKAGLAG